MIGLNNRSSTRKPANGSVAVTGVPMTRGVTVAVGASVASGCAVGWVTGVGVAGGSVGRGVSSVLGTYLVGVGAGGAWGAQAPARSARRPRRYSLRIRR